jgi:hypothetical protein
LRYGASSDRRYTPAKATSVVPREVPRPGAPYRTTQDKRRSAAGILKHRTILQSRRIVPLVAWPNKERLDGRGLSPQDALQELTERLEG